ncbi:Protein of unknown function, partial [Cotesia congregata]
GLQKTIDKLEKKWSEAGIPTCGKKYPLKKFEKILEEDKKLQKSSQRKRSAIQKKNEAIFHQKLANLFNIAKVNVEKYLTDDKKLFLSGQRSKSRFGLIDNVVQLSSAENTEDAMDVEPVDTNEPDKVDQSNYKSGIEDETVANTLIEKKKRNCYFH